MYCMVCGNKIDQPPDKVTFCPFCGADISKKRQTIMGGVGAANTETRFSSPSMETTSMGNGTPTPTSIPSSGFQSSNPGFQPNNAGYNYRTPVPPNTPPMWGSSYGSTPQAYGTPYQPSPQYRLFASFGERLVAWVIDMIVLYLIGSFITPFFLEDMGNQVLSMIENMNPETISDAEYNALMSTAMSFLMLSELIGWIISFIYFFLLTWLTKGRTLGKMALKLVVVDQETLQPVENPGRILLESITKRPILLFFDIIIGAIAGSRPRNQYRVTQKLSRTVVVKKNMLMNSVPTIDPEPRF